MSDDLRIEVRFPSTMIGDIERARELLALLTDDMVRKAILQPGIPISPPPADDAMREAEVAA